MTYRALLLLTLSLAACTDTNIAPLCDETFSVDLDWDEPAERLPSAAEWFDTYALSAANPALWGQPAGDFTPINSGRLWFDLTITPDEEAKVTYREYSASEACPSAVLEIEVATRVDDTDLEGWDGPPDEGYGDVLSIPTGEPPFLGAFGGNGAIWSITSGPELAAVEAQLPEGQTLDRLRVDMGREGLSLGAEYSQDDGTTIDAVVQEIGWAGLFATVQ